MSPELKAVFEYVKNHPGCSARQVGKAIPGGKSRANHYLYGYAGILFFKRGATPPLWTVISTDAHSKMLTRINPDPPSRPTPAPNAAPQARRRLSPRRALPLAITKFEPPQDFADRQINICPSCDLPIRPTGACGCS